MFYFWISSNCSVVEHIIGKKKKIHEMKIQMLHFWFSSHLSCSSFRERAVDMLAAGMTTRAVELNVHFLHHKPSPKALQ